MILTNIKAAVSAAAVILSVLQPFPADLFTVQARAKKGLSLAPPVFGIYNESSDGSGLSVSVSSPLTGNVTLDGVPAELPSSYSLRDENKMSPVRDQTGYGTCWAHGAAACAEAQLYQHGQAVDLSEFQVAGQFYRDLEPSASLEEQLDKGANSDAVITLWSQWRGPVDESLMPYGDTEILKENIDCNDAIYHLENAYTFDYDHDRTNEAEVNTLVKQFVFSSKPVEVSYCSNISKYYDSEHYSTYCRKRPRFANHAVTIAGWSDDFPKEDFRTQPEHNGAWLCKNSWGANYADGGYIWISYDDLSLSEFTVFDFGRADNFDTIYQHDTYSAMQSISVHEDAGETGLPAYMANIYTSGEDENIEAVSTFIREPGTEYRIWVYTGLTDPADPVSGTAHEAASGTCDISGYQTIRLDEPVFSKAGERFSVVAELISDTSDFTIPVECVIACENSTTGEISCIDTYTNYDVITEYTHSGESFYSTDATEWQDIKGDDIHYTEEEEQELLDAIYEQLMDGVEEEDIDIIAQVNDQMDNFRSEFAAGEVSAVMGNISLKAFASPAGKVKFSSLDGMTADKVSLYTTDNSRIMYFTDADKTLREYTEPIEITSAVKITAFSDTCPDQVTGCFTPVQPSLQKLEYSFGSGTVKKRYAFSPPYTTPDEITLRSAGNENRLWLRIFSDASITVNGTEVLSGQYGSAVDISDRTAPVNIVLRQDGMDDRTIKINVINDPVWIDPETSVIHFADGEGTASDPSGKVYTEGSVVAAAEGQTLTYTLEDGTAGEIFVKYHTDLSSTYLDYRYSSLTLPQEYGKLEYSAGGGEWTEISDRLLTDSEGDHFFVFGGETITLREAGDEKHVPSEPVAFVIPDAPDAPTELQEFTLDDGRIVLPDDSNMVIAAIVDMPDITYNDLAKFGYADEESFFKAFRRAFGAETDEEVMKIYLADWQQSEYAPIAGEPIAVRYKATETALPSQVLITTVTAIRKGDVNKDGYVDAADASIVLEHYASASTGGEPVLTGEMFSIGDYDQSGVIDSTDASEILIFYALMATNQ